MAKWKYGYHVREGAPNTVVYRSPGGVVSPVAEVSRGHDAGWVAKACEEKAKREAKTLRLVAAVQALPGG